MGVGLWDNRQPPVSHQECVPDRTVSRLRASRSADGRRRGIFSPSVCAVNYCETVAVLAQQPEGWDRWAGTAGPPTEPGLLVGEALVPDGWEDSVGIEL